MRAFIVATVGILALTIVPNAQAFHKHPHPWCCHAGAGYYIGPGQTFAAPGYSYRALPAMSYAPAGTFMALPAASFYTPSYSYAPAASYSYAPASYSHAPAASYNDPAAGLNIGSLTAILDVLDRVTTWTDKHRGGSGGSGGSNKKLDDLAKDVEDMKKTLANLKPVENLDDRLKKLSTDLQLQNAKLDKFQATTEADIKAIKMKLNLP